MTKSNRKPFSILIADDDEDDRSLAIEALESKLVKPIDVVENGVELLAYLQQKTSTGGSPRQLPGLIILDLNMPKMDGREAVPGDQGRPELRRIPIIVIDHIGKRRGRLPDLRSPRHRLVRHQAGDVRGVWSLS